MERRISMSTPAVGSSRISSRGSCTRARAIIRRRLSPPESTRISSRAVPELQLAQVELRPLPCLPPRDAVVARLVEHHLDHRQEEVEVELLGHQAQAGLHRLRIPVQVVPKTSTCPPVLLTREVTMPIRVDFARPIGTEQGEEVTLLHPEVYALEGLVAIAVDLGEIAYGECGHGSQHTRLKPTNVAERRRRARAPIRKDAKKIPRGLCVPRRESCPWLCAGRFIAD